jgi:hypothetical protein
MAPEEKATELQRIIDEQRVINDQLTKDKNALAEEFAKAGTYDETVDVARKGIAEMLELAVTTAKNLLVNATSESVQASMSKFVIETVISGKLDIQPEGEIKNLLKRLADNDPKFKEEATVIVAANIDA